VGRITGRFSRRRSQVAPKQLLRSPRLSARSVRWQRWLNASPTGSYRIRIEMMSRGRSFGSDRRPVDWGSALPDEEGLYSPNVLRSGCWRWGARMVCTISQRGR